MSNAQAKYFIYAGKVYEGNVSFLEGLLPNGWQQRTKQGDVKKLTNHSPEYRMWSGNFRVLFEIEEERIVVYRVLHRKEAYL